MYRFNPLLHFKQKTTNYYPSNIINHIKARLYRSFLKPYKTLKPEKVPNYPEQDLRKLGTQDRYFKVTLVRSRIGLSRKTKYMILSLGLNKTNKTIYTPVNAEYVGALFRLKEVIRIELVDKIESISNKPPKGYEVICNRNKIYDELYAVD